MLLVEIDVIAGVVLLAVVGARDIDDDTYRRRVRRVAQSFVAAYSTQEFVPRQGHARGAPAYVIQQWCRSHDVLRRDDDRRRDDPAPIRGSDEVSPGR